MKLGLSTEELAEKIGIKPESIRMHFQRKGGRKGGGNYCGIAPRLMANGRLLWPLDAPVRILGMEADQGADPKAA